MMVAESSYSTSLINQFAILDVPRNPQGYFRSKLFITSSSSHPLIAAASPLLSLLERLCISPTLPAIESIRDNIEHELLAFHSRLSTQNYAEEFIIIAYYLLSATIDELLGKNYLRLDNRAPEFKAFTPSSHDGIGPEHRFFTLIDYLKERAQQYLDLLELSYYCLISGFEGKYHLRADGRQTLDNLIEELHQLIQLHRVYKPHRLLNDMPQVSVESKSNKRLMLVSCLVFGLLSSMYFGSQSVLEHKAKNLILSNPQLLDMDS